MAELLTAQSGCKLPTQHAGLGNEQPYTAPKVAISSFPKQPCAVIKYCPWPPARAFPPQLCLVSLCRGDAGRVFCSTSVLCEYVVVQRKSLSDHSPAALALQIAPPLPGWGFHFLRPACRQPSNLRRPRPKTTRTEPACIVEPQHHPACQLSRPSPINYRHHALPFPLASCRQEPAASLTVSAGLGSRDHASFFPNRGPELSPLPMSSCQLRAEENQGMLGNMIWFIWFDRFSSTGGGRGCCVTVQESVGATDSQRPRSCRRSPAESLVGGLDAVHHLLDSAPIASF
jgi:hypothetical protein